MLYYDNGPSVYQLPGGIKPLTSIENVMIRSKGPPNIVHTSTHQATGKPVQQNPVEGAVAQAATTTSFATRQQATFSSACPGILQPPAPILQYSAAPQVGNTQSTAVAFPHPQRTASLDILQTPRTQQLKVQLKQQNPGALFEEIWYSKLHDMDRLEMLTLIV